MRALALIVAVSFLAVPSNNIENTWCGSTVQGQDNEWNVARTFWDLYDAAPDGSDLSGYGSDNVNPSTNSIWKVMVSQADPQSLGDFRAKWLNMGYSSPMFTGTSSQNQITW